MITVNENFLHDFNNAFKFLIHIMTVIVCKLNSISVVKGDVQNTLLFMHV